MWCFPPAPLGTNKTLLNKIILYKMITIKTIYGLIFYPNSNRSDVIKHLTNNGLNQTMKTPENKDQFQLI